MAKQGNGESSSEPLSEKDDQRSSRGKIVVGEDKDCSVSSAEDDDEDYYDEDECCDQDGDEEPQVVGSAVSAGGTFGSRPSTRSSVKYVVAVVSKFDEMKRNLVKSIGFGGILEIPQINKVSREFTLWLLSNLEPGTRTIVVDGEPVIDLVDLDVKRVLGIPCGPKKVTGLGTDDARAKRQFMEQVIGATPNEKNCLLAAGRIVSKKYANPMSKTECNHFKAAFVVFVVGHLLAPTTKNNVGSSSFWGALRNPDQIAAYNWGEYVLEQLVEAAKKVQSDIKIKKKVSNITGCSIFLQIMYLDSIRIKGMERPHHVLPKIKAYDCAVLRRMMEADQANSSAGSSKKTWGSNLSRRLMTPADATNQAEYCAIEQNELPSVGSYTVELATFIRENFSGQLNQSQLDAMKVYSTRCETHFDKLKTSLMKENLVLLQFLMSTSGDKNKEPESNPIVGAKRRSDRISIRTNRGYESADEGYMLRRRPRMAMHSRTHEVPETILSGGSIRPSTAHQSETIGKVAAMFGNVSAEVVLTTGRCENTNSTGHPNQHALGGAIEPPSFDLGLDIDPDPKVNEEMHKEVKDANTSNQAAEVAQVSAVNSTEGQIITEEQLDIVSGTPVSAKRKAEDKTWTTPDQRFRSSTVSPGSMSKIFANCEIMGRMILSEDEINVNVKPFVDDITDSPVNKQVVEMSRIAKSPWFYDLKHDLCIISKASAIFDGVMRSTVNDLERIWIAHGHPRYLEVKGMELANTFSLKQPMSYNMFDLALRRIVQLDNVMYKACNGKRWRHMLESDFAVLSQASENPSCMKSIRVQFFSSTINYQINLCRMIIVPAQVLMDWCCYFWDFKKKTIHVIDPLFKEDTRDFYMKKHADIVDRIGAELAKCISMFFENWEVNWDHWRTDYVVTPIANTSSNETGLQSLLSIREFDGDGFRNFNKESYEEFEKVLLAEMLWMDDNQAEHPFKAVKEKQAVKVVYDVSE